MGKLHSWNLSFHSFDYSLIYIIIYLCTILLDGLKYPYALKKNSHMMILQLIVWLAMSIKVSREIGLPKFST